MGLCCTTQAVSGRGEESVVQNQVGGDDDIHPWDSSGQLAGIEKGGEWKWDNRIEGGDWMDGVLIPGGDWPVQWAVAAARRQAAGFPHSLRYNSCPVFRSGLGILCSVILVGLLKRDRPNQDKRRPNGMMVVDWAQWRPKKKQKQPGANEQTEMKSASH